MTGLGIGGDGPWEDRSVLFIAWAREQHNPTVVAGHLNRTYSVQRRRYPQHPGWDLLTIRRHDDRPEHPGWLVLQKIKDRLAPDGAARFGFEVFPPRRWIIDNCHLWHVWVMPLGVEPGIGFHPDQQGGGLRI